jgi:di/tricarboxylate transporter
MNSFLFVLAIGVSFLALYVSFLALYQAFAHEDKNVSGGDGIDQGFVRQEKKTMTDNVNREAQGNKFAAGGFFLAGLGWVLNGLLLSNDGTTIAIGMMFMCLGLMCLSMAKRAEKTEVGNHQEAERAYKAETGDA